MRLKSFLSSLRFIALLIIAILLLKPFIIQIIEEEEKPKLLIYSDQSASVTQIEKDQVAEFILKAQTDLSEKYEVEGFSFASAVNTSPDSAALDPLHRFG